MTVILFSPRFAPLVENGAKLQTIRKERKRPIKVGDMLSLRTWEGVPRRSKQRILREPTPCIGIDAISIDEEGVAVEEPEFMLYLMNTGLNAFAQADGFCDWYDMRDWFHDTHGLPFTGVLIRWAP